MTSYLPGPVASVVNTLLDQEEHFTFAEWYPGVMATIDVTIFAVGFYLILVFKGPEWMAKRPAYRLKGARATWNLSLSLFSILGGSRVIPKLYSLIRERGLHYSVCAPVKESGIYDHQPGFWLCMFIFSKMPELIDTVFLVLNKKPVIFLHWYHHITVLLFCFFMCATLSSAGIWFAAMNYFVHSLMYMYYFLMTLNSRGVARSFASSITSLQILQMFMGIFIIFVILIPQFIWGSDCATSLPAARLGLGMYGTYFWLFAKFFVEKYITKKSDGATPAPLAPTVTTLPSSAVVYHPRRTSSGSSRGGKGSKGKSRSVD